MGTERGRELSRWGDLGQLAAPVADRIQRLDSSGFVRRFWDNDPSLWSDSSEGQAEASRRLGWLRSPQKATARLPMYRKFADEIRAAGITRFLVLGMGGSSLATEVIGTVFAEDLATASHRLGILDSTHPDQVSRAARQFPPGSSLYIISSKSGGTAEVMAAFEHIWNLTGRDGAHFIAISDEGTSLQGLARERCFRMAFTADSTVGGRYSALTDFGMIPAALAGIDLARLLDRAVEMQRQCGPSISAATNPGVVLGAFMGEAALRGSNKLTLLADGAIAPLSCWIEQLVAESSGKQGKGILPVALEPLDLPEVYGQDRIFAYLRQSGELDAGVKALRAAGFPVITLDIPDSYAVAAEFMRWEVAVAAACHIIGVNAFDQPDVQESKDRTRSKIEMLQSRGRIDEGQWDVDIAGGMQLRAAGALLRTFLEQGQRGNYVAVNAYLPMRADVTEELQRLRVLIRERTHLATTVGFGPRFQHSTGQFHKGGPNHGLFIQVIGEPESDLMIPGGALSFGALIRAQALGDYETLLARKRRVVRVRLGRTEDVELLRRSMDEQIA